MSDLQPGTEINDKWSQSIQLWWGGGAGEWGCSSLPGVLPAALCCQALNQDLVLQRLVHPRPSDKTNLVLITVKRGPISTDTWDYRENEEKCLSPVILSLRVLLPL